MQSLVGARRASLLSRLQLRLLGRLRGRTARSLAARKASAGSGLFPCGTLLVVLTVGAATAAPPFLTVPEALRQPRVDASPGDPAWSAAAIIRELTLADGADARLKVSGTQVFVLWSKSYLFVRFVCADGEVFTPHRGRDKPHHQGDVAEIFLDPEGRARRWIEIQVTPRNDVFDKTSTLPRRPRSQPDGVLAPESMRMLSEDERFDLAGLRTAAGRLPGGWIVDVVIPAAAITGSSAKPLKPRKIRANFVRYDWPESSGGRRLVPLNWSPVRLGCPHISPVRMGVLRLVRRSP